LYAKEASLKTEQFAKSGAPNCSLRSLCTVDPSCHQTHISVASPVDASNEIPAEKDHHEEQEGEESTNKTLGTILQL